MVDPGFFQEEVCFYQAIGWVPAGWRAETRLTTPDGEDVSVGCEGPESFVWAVLDRDAEPADFVFVLNRKARWRPEDSALAGFGGPPVYAISLQGVPLFMVYRTR